MDQPAYKVSSLSKTYSISEKQISVLQEIDFQVPVNQWIAITGQSGCGKTTLLRILGALDKSDTGTIECFGEDVTQMTINQKAGLRRNKIGFIFQSYQLLPELNALENIMLPGRLAKKELKIIKNRALDLMKILEIENRVHHRPTELSGGEQQRIAIARALMNQPDIILADEPTGNLDNKNSIAIMNILEDLKVHEQKTIVMVTHNINLTDYADKSYHIEAGSLVEH